MHSGCVKLALKEDKRVRCPLLNALFHAIGKHRLQDAHPAFDVVDLSFHAAKRQAVPCRWVVTQVRMASSTLQAQAGAESCLVVAEGHPGSAELMSALNCIPLPSLIQALISQTCASLISSPSHDRRETTLGDKWMHLF